MKTMKRFGCLLLVLAMVLALGVSAMAAPQTLAHSGDDEDAITGSITISGAIANETYTIYQIFDLTYTDDLATDDEGGTISGSASSYSYKVCEGWSDFLKSYTVNVDGYNTDLFTLTNEGYVDPSSLIFTYGEDDSKVTDEVMADFARAALAYAEKSSGITGTSVKYTYDVATGTATLDPQNNSISISNLSMDENGYVTGDLTFKGLSLGYYLVDTSLGTLCMLDSTDPSAVINEKNGEPTIKKYVHENSASDSEFGPEDDAYNGDLIKFEIEVDDIAGAVNLVVHDAMDDELSIPDEKDFDIKATLYTSSDAEGVTLTKATWDENAGTWIGGDYYITTGTCSADACSFGDDSEYGDCDFEIHFLREFNDVDSTGYIEFTYELLLNTEDDEYYDDYEEIDNWAQVTFGNASASLVVEAETFTFGFEVWKYTGDMSVVWTSISQPSGTTDVYLCYTMGEGDDAVRYYAIVEASDSEGCGTSAEDPYVVIGWTTDVNEAWYVEISNYTSEESGEDDGSHREGGDFYFTGMIGADNCHLYVVSQMRGDWQPMETDDLELVGGTGTPATALAGASFQVTNSGGEVAYFETEKLDDKTIYLFEGWWDGTGTLDEKYTTTLTTADDGLLNIEGLDAGTYTLTEIAAPDGYNLLDDSITVKIEAKYDETTGAMISHTVSYTYGESGSGTGVVYVQNNAGSILPGTGGIGTTIFYVVGAILVCGAVVLLVTKRRTSNKNQAEA